MGKRKLSVKIPEMPDMSMKFLPYADIYGIRNSKPTETSVLFENDEGMVQYALPDEPTGTGYYPLNLEITPWGEVTFRDKDGKRRRAANGDEVRVAGKEGKEIFFDFANNCYYADGSGMVPDNDDNVFIPETPSPLAAERQEPPRKLYDRDEMAKRLYCDEDLDMFLGASDQAPAFNSDVHENSRSRAITQKAPTEGCRLFRVVNPGKKGKKGTRHERTTTIKYMLPGDTEPRDVTSLCMEVLHASYFCNEDGMRCYVSTGHLVTAGAQPDYFRDFDNTWRHVFTMQPVKDRQVCLAAGARAT